MIHSRGLNSAAHGSRLPRIASPQDFQRCRPRSHLMWQLADGRLVRHDRTFPPLGAEAEVRPSLPTLTVPDAQRPTLVGTVRDVDEDAEGEMMAQLIWHHGERSYPSHLINLAHKSLRSLLRRHAGVRALAAAARRPLVRVEPRSRAGPWQRGGG